MYRHCTVRIALVFLSSLLVSETRAAIWVDTDPVCFEPGFSDIDDCLALTLLFATMREEILIVSATDGNSNVAVTRSNLEELVGSVGKNMYIEQDITNIATTIRNHYKVHRNKITILALGSLSNISAVVRNLDLPSNYIDEILVVGGQTARGVLKVNNSSLFHMHDLNMVADINSTLYLLDSGIKLRFFPFELAKQSKTKYENIKELTEFYKPAEVLLKPTEKWLRYWQLYFKQNGFYPFDVMVIGYLSNPESYGCFSASYKHFSRHSFLVRSRDQFVFEPVVDSSTKYCNKYRSNMNVVSKIINTSLQRPASNH